ncbi:DNA ligase [Marinobacterium aestuariivivens]|uniref:DNA ligase n=1 Tax=Marinobacterium aestuariivivens TaxID=1698799 RepID=A0ABW1ZWY1_9GAMM
MSCSRDSLMLVLGVLSAAAPLAEVVAAPVPLMLAQEYRGDIEIGDYWASEKLDGVRAWWDGKRLLTRGGYAVSVPDAFTHGWPDQPLDGELWLGRGRFAEVSALARAYEPDARAWREVRFMVFDLPAFPGSFGRRQAELRRRLENHANTRLQIVEQVRPGSREELELMLDRIVAAGGEGVMLHRDAALYRAGRSDELLKYKRHQDAEAIVIGYLPGEGKYNGLVGALLVEDDSGRRFRLGSGLDDADREAPPPLGARVTYRYNGLTVNGLPRFARYLRIRSD